jgi:hypothetical protein
VQRARAEVARAGGTTTWPGVSAALAMRVLARVCMSWARLGVTFLAATVHDFVEGCVGHDQESERELGDIVVHVVVDQR